MVEDERMRWVVSLSGGAASAVAADLVIGRYGRKYVDLWFADVLTEDPDLYRFNADVMARWGGTLVTHRDGRTPWEVAEQKRVIPNNLLAPCTHELKIEPFVRFLTANYAPGEATVVLGLGAWEPARLVGPRRRYGGLGYEVDYPLDWPQARWVTADHCLTLIERGWGIAVPALYKQGFAHNNCGGACVRGGVEQWTRLYHLHRDRFDRAATWERQQRAKGGGRATRAILRRTVGGVARALPLDELAEAIESGRVTVQNGRAVWRT